MHASTRSISSTNTALMRAFDDIFSPADEVLTQHKDGHRRFPLGDLVESDLDTDWEILDAMPNGTKNWCDE